MDEFLRSRLDQNPDSGVMILGLMVCSLIFFIVLYFILRDDPEKRIHQRFEQLLELQGPGVKSKTSVDPLFQYLINLGRSFIPKASKELDDIRGRLAGAGYRSPDAIAGFYGLRLCLMLGLPLMVFLLTRTLTDLPLTKSMVYALCAGGVGMIAPSYVLDKRLLARQKTLRNALPDALDLMVVCSEAGLSINASMLRVASEIEGVHPDLSSEFHQVTSEIQGGLDREQALMNMSERTGIKEMKSLVMVINQTLKLGTSIADTLRSYSDEYRQTRMQAAEEQAGQLSTKMIFPLVLCFLPCFFIVSVGPAVLKMIKVMH